MKDAWTFGGYELRTPEEIAQDNKAEADAETEAILSYMDAEEPLVRCPLCGCGDPEEVEVRYCEYPVDFGAYWQTGDRFRCKACGAEGEYD